MKLSISIESDGNVILVDIPGDLTLEDFKAYLQAETDVEPKSQILKHNGKTLQNDKKDLNELGVKEDDLIVLAKFSTRSTASSSAGIPIPEDGVTSNLIDNRIETMRQQYLNNPSMNAQLRAAFPQVHRLLNNPEEFKKNFWDQIRQYQNLGFGGSQNNAEEMRRLQENPDDPANQERILELIREEQIEKNYDLAFEMAPETLVRVGSLYINVYLNGHKVQALVDTGAQMSCLSSRLAEEVGLSRLIDKRAQGEVRGVGSQQSLGKIHSAPIRIGDSEIDLPCSFTVLDFRFEFILGLDLLSRHGCVIDLNRNVLSVAGKIETKFLHESEIEQKREFGLDGYVLGERPGAGALSGLGGNIFTDGAPVVPVNSTPVSAAPTESSSATKAAADAASKRQNTGSSSDTYTPKESDVVQLIGLGFSRPDAEIALKQTNGDVDLAASLLFQ